MTARLISVIGPPAVGKTTLAEALAKELPARLIYEDYAGNPFLAESYAGGREARLPAQIYFLLSRVAQLSRRQWPPEGLVVSDYGFCQDRLFAAARLSGEEYPVYEAVLRRVEGLVRGPDVLVHLDAREATLLGRIARRGREFERVMDERFLCAMRQAYNTAAAAQACRVIRVDCDAADVRDPAVRAGIVQQIRESL